MGEETGESEGVLMTNLGKMNELVEANASEDDVVGWACMNRIWLVDLPLEDEFVSMKKSVDVFMKQEKELRYEHEMWRDFLKAKFVK